MDETKIEELKKIQNDDISRIINFFNIAEVKFKITDKNDNFNTQEYKNKSIIQNIFNLNPEKIEIEIENRKYNYKIYRYR